MNIFDYQQGIHPDTGKILSFDQDILITPFYTEDYCQTIVNFCKQYSNYFVNTGPQYDDPYSNNSLYLDRISPLLFDQYVNHFMSKITPVVNKLFLWDRNIEGFFSPFINRFSPDTQSFMPLHCEESRISIVVKLNNDFQGGFLNFPRQKITSQNLPVGHAFVFPGMVTHPHYVDTLISGQRFTLTGFTVPPFWKSNDVTHWSNVNIIKLS